MKLPVSPQPALRQPFIERPPLNNLDLFDSSLEPGSQLYAAEQTAENGNFFDGLEAYRQSLLNDKLLNSPNLTATQKLVLGAAAYILGNALSQHAVPSHNLQFMDRVQNANLYVTRVAKVFDQSRGTDFIAFLRPFLKLHIDRVEDGAQADLNQGDIIRIPLERSNYHRINKLRQKQTAKYRRLLDIEELSQFSNDVSTAQEQVDEYQAICVEHLPIHELYNHAEFSAITNSKSPEPLEELTKWPEFNGVGTALSLLNPVEAKVLTMHYGLSPACDRMTLQEIAKIYDVSRTRIQIIEKQALHKLQGKPNIASLILGETVVGGQTKEVQMILPTDLESDRKIIKQLVGLLKRNGVPKKVFASSINISPQTLTDCLNNNNNFARKQLTPAYAKKITARLAELIPTIDMDDNRSAAAKSQLAVLVERYPVQTINQLD